MGHDHDHTHEPFDSPGLFAERESMDPHRDFADRAFTVGIGGPVGSGKTALLQALCERLRDEYSLGVVTNDIFTREDISLNLNALEDLMDRFAGGIDLLLVESGGDNLAAHFSRELVDYSVYVIDVSGGDKIPRKGGPGTTQSDLLVINKTDLAEMVGADLGVMDRDAKKMRGEGPTVFACIKDREGLEAIVEHILKAREAAPFLSDGLGSDLLGALGRGNGIATRSQIETAKDLVWRFGGWHLG